MNTEKTVVELLVEREVLLQTIETQKETIKRLLDAYILKN